MFVNFRDEHGAPLIFCIVVGMSENAVLDDNAVATAFPLSLATLTEP